MVKFNKKLILPITVWLTPALAISFIFRSISGTDLVHYHRFQKEAEALRYSFVQGLNSAHLNKLSYEDDINRNKDTESGLRARVDASNWKVLDSYQFKTAKVSDRLNSALHSIQILIVWMLVLFVALVWCGRGIKP